VPKTKKKKKKKKPADDFFEVGELLPGGERAGGVTDFAELNR
jgi:hypothetical protein